MKKLFILSIFRLGLILMTVSLLGLVIVYLLELGFQITHGSSNFVFVVLATMFFTPLIFLSFLGAAFFNKKLAVHKQIASVTAS